MNTISSVNFCHFLLKFCLSDLHLVIAIHFAEDELVGMVLTLGEAACNGFLAARIYKQKYPKQRHTKSEAFERLKRKIYCHDKCNVHTI